MDIATRLAVDVEIDWPCAVGAHVIGPEGGRADDVIDHESRLPIIVNDVVRAPTANAVGDIAFPEPEPRAVVLVPPTDVIGRFMRVEMTVAAGVEPQHATA